MAVGAAATAAWGAGWLEGSGIALHRSGAILASTQTRPGASPAPTPPAIPAPTVRTTRVLKTPVPIKSPTGDAAGLVAVSNLLDAAPAGGRGAPARAPHRRRALLVVGLVVLVLVAGAVAALRRDYTTPPPPPASPASPSDVTIDLPFAVASASYAETRDGSCLASSKTTDRSDAYACAYQIEADGTRKQYAADPCFRATDEGYVVCPGDAFGVVGVRLQLSEPLPEATNVGTGTQPFAMRLKDGKVCAASANPIEAPGLDARYQCVASAGGHEIVAAATAPDTSVQPYTVQVVDATTNKMGAIVVGSDQPMTVAVFEVRR